MNRNRVEQIIEYVKGSPETMDYGRWGALNPEQRHFIKELCNSWLVLDEATNMQTEEIERLNNIIKEVREYIENNLYGDYGYECKQSKKELLEILDKGE